MVDWSCLNASYNIKWISKSEITCLAANHSCKQATAWVFYQHEYYKENKDNKQKPKRQTYLHVYVFIEFNLIW